MPCNPLYGADRTVTGFVCTRGRRGKSAKPCGSCKRRPHTLLCDGCDAPLCYPCSIGVRAVDVDFCPACATKNAPGCQLQEKTPQPCSGPIVVRDGICLAHDIIFSWWLSRAEGWANVYSRGDLSREEKRARFVAWVHENETRARWVVRAQMEARHG